MIPKKPHTWFYLAGESVLELRALADQLDHLSKLAFVVTKDMKAMMAVIFKDLDGTCAQNR